MPIFDTETRLTQGVSVLHSCHKSKTINTIVSILKTLTLWMDEIPPLQQATRYRNIAYRTWHELLVNSDESLTFKFLPDNLKPTTVELVSYFSDSFNNAS